MLREVSTSFECLAVVKFKTGLDSGGIGRRSDACGTQVECTMYGVNPYLSIRVGTHINVHSGDMQGCELRNLFQQPMLKGKR